MSADLSQLICVHCDRPCNDHDDDCLMVQNINHPPHYGGADNPYEAIKVIEAWELGFCLGNTVKYISRAGKKGEAYKELEDLKKARWYLDREITNRDSHTHTERR